MSKSKIKNTNKRINFAPLRKLLPKLNFKKFELQLLGIFLVVQFVLAALSFYENSFQFSYTFLNAYYITLVCIYLIVTTVLLFSYRSYTKKTFGFWFYIFYLFTTLFLTYNIISLNPSLENITNRAFFSNSNYIFIILILTLVLTVISKYDFPLTENFVEFYHESITHFKRNLGVFISIAVLVSVLGFYVGTFVYAISFILVIDSVYLLKALLANIRR